MMEPGTLTADITTELIMSTDVPMIEKNDPRLTGQVHLRIR